MQDAEPSAPRRGGAELIRATAPFEAENRLVSYLLLAQTLAVLGGLLALVVWSPYWPVQLLAGLLAGLLQVRLFIFYHDAVHGALFRKDPVAAVIMSVVGFYLLAVRSVWKESHDFHHQHNGKIASSAIGSFPILSQDAIKSTSPGQLRAYALIRHPLSIAGGYFTVFILGMGVMPFLRRPGRHWVAPVSLVVHVLLVGVAVYGLGWVTAICALVIPPMISMALGSYLFYAQHNFPAMQIRSGADWDYVTAALQGSSMFRMSRLMHWFTGNIGYHHVHHVNHRIPFYRLPETMQAIPELQDPGCTSWRIADVLACLRLYAWDARQGRMLTYAESRAAAA